MQELSTSFEKLMTEIAKTHGWAIRTEGDSCVLTLDVRDGRHQEVRVTTGVDHMRNPTVLFYSKVGLLKDVDPERALRANAVTSYGALAAIGDELVMRGTTFVGQGSLSAKELGAMIRHIAIYADHIERELYGSKDRF